MGNDWGIGTVCIDTAKFCRGCRSGKDYRLGADTPTRQTLLGFPLVGGGGRFHLFEIRRRTTDHVYISSNIVRLQDTLLVRACVKTCVILCALIVMPRRMVYWFSIDQCFFD